MPNELTDALPCPYCGATPDVDSYGDITCPIGLTSQEGREEHEQQGLFCRNDSIMKLDDWNRRSENGAPPALLAAAREAARLREENKRLREENKRLREELATMKQIMQMNGWHEVRDNGGIPYWTRGQGATT